MSEGGKWWKWPLVAGGLAGGAVGATNEAIKPHPDTLLTPEGVSYTQVTEKPEELKVKLAEAEQIPSPDTGNQ